MGHMTASAEGLLEMWSSHVPEEMDLVSVWQLSARDGISVSLEGVLVFYSCHNKLPQIGQLITTKISSFTILESRSLKSSCWQSMLPLKALGENLSLPLPAFGGCQ